MGRHNRVLAFLVLPGLVLFWGVGWVLYWIGSRREIEEPKKSSIVDDLEMFVLSSEERDSDENAVSNSLEA